jgi:hypothetical protein
MNFVRSRQHSFFTMTYTTLLGCVIFLSCAGIDSTLAQTSSSADDQSADNGTLPTDGDFTRDKDELLDPKPSAPTIEIPKSWIRLSPKDEIWLDRKKKLVIIGGEICLNAGQLEMFICPPQTKLHESIVVAKCQSWQVHAALVAIGASPGKTAQWAPDYEPAWGPKIDIEMIWRDEPSGKTKRADAKQWIQNLDTEKAMKADWVFGGSMMDKNPETGENVYLGNFGELVCLSNFSTATIDLNVESSQYETLFVAFEKNIPPVGTQVYAVLKPGKIIGKPSQTKSTKPEPAPPFPRAGEEPTTKTEQESAAPPVATDDSTSAEKSSTGKSENGQ